MHSGSTQGYKCQERVKQRDYCSSKAAVHESLDFQTVWHPVTLTICASHDMIQEVYQNACSVLFRWASSTPGHLPNSENPVENTKNERFPSKERKGFRKSFRKVLEKD